LQPGGVNFLDFKLFDLADFINLKYQRLTTSRLKAIKINKIQNMKQEIIDLLKGIIF